MRDSAKYFVLVVNVVDLFTLDDVFFFHDLDTTVSAVLLFFNKFDPAK